MRRRGYALMVVVLAMSAATAAAVVFATRLSVNSNARVADALRLQSLWLARSGCNVQLAARRTIRTAQGNATLSRAGTVVKVELGRGTATVDCEGGQERYLSR